MAKSGQLGGEMVKRMIESQEKALIDSFNDNQLQ